MGTIFCPFCGTQVPQAETKCVKCGASLEGDVRGSTLMGMSALQARESLKREMEAARAKAPAEEAKGDPDAPQIRSFSPAQTTKEAEPSPRREEEQKNTERPEESGAVTPYEGNSWVMESGPVKEGRSSSKSSPPSGEWSAGEEPVSDNSLEEGNPGDSLMLRPGDLIDPVTGLPMRAFRSKPKSKLPYALFGLLTLAVASLGFYVFTRPEPPPVLRVANESLSLVGDGVYEVLVDGSKVVGCQAVRVKGIEAPFEEGAQARLSLPEAAVPLGKSEMPAEVQINGEWREATALSLFRPARVRATVDAAKDALVLEFTLVEGSTSVKIQDQEGMASEGKARVELPLRKIALPGETGESTRTLAFEVVGVGQTGQITVKVPAPKPAFVFKGPADYTAVEKGVQEIPLEFESAPDAKITVTVNGEPLSPKDNSYIAKLREKENVIEIKAELDGEVAGEKTIRIFRGKAPEGWNPSDGGGKKTP